MSFGQWVDEFLNCWVLCVLGWLAPCWLDHQSGEWIRAGALIPTGKKTLSMKSSLNESRLNLHPYPWFKKQNLLSVSHLPENKQWFSLGPDPTGPPCEAKSPSLDTAFRGSFWVQVCWVWPRVGGSEKKGTSPLMPICWAPAACPVLHTWCSKLLHWSQDWHGDQLYYPAVKRKRCM